MKIGFENEYFVLNPQTGKYLQTVPYDVPHDAASTLVEVRSDPFDKPNLVLDSFKTRYDELNQAIKAKGLALANLAECPTVIWHGQPETAGFHIHFSNDSWKGLPTDHRIYGWETLHDNPPKEIAEMMKDLDVVFKQYYTGVRRHPHIWRPKRWGWEYRRLPATIDPGIVAARLTELYYPERVALRKKVA